MIARPPDNINSYIDGDMLNLAEIALSANGQPVAVTGIAMSSVYTADGIDESAAKGIDGDPTTFCSPDLYSNPPNAEPTISLLYPCPTGKVTPMTVQITNRQLSN